jgi:hypothetical protein
MSKGGWQCKWPPHKSIREEGDGRGQEEEELVITSCSLASQFKSL